MNLEVSDAWWNLVTSRVHLCQGDEQWQGRRGKQERPGVRQDVRHDERRGNPGALDVDLHARCDVLDGEPPERFAAWHVRERGGLSERAGRLLG